MPHMSLLVLWRSRLNPDVGETPYVMKFSQGTSTFDASHSSPTKPFDKSSISEYSQSNFLDHCPNVIENYHECDTVYAQSF
jgi:hypothetical protein